MAEFPSASASWRAVLTMAFIWIALTLVSWFVYLRSRPGLPRGVYIYHSISWRDHVPGVVWAAIVFAVPAVLIVWKVARG